MIAGRRSSFRWRWVRFEFAGKVYVGEERSWLAGPAQVTVAQCLTYAPLTGKMFVVLLHNVTDLLEHVRSDFGSIIMLRKRDVLYCFPLTI